MTTGPRLFSLFPPAFAAVPQYPIHITVELLSLTEPDKQLSHIRLLAPSFSTPPPYDTGSGLCGLSVVATSPSSMPGQSAPRCMPCADSCG